jgi:hypothetical protein
MSSGYDAIAIPGLHRPRRDASGWLAKPDAGPTNGITWLRREY